MVRKTVYIPQEKDLYSNVDILCPFFKLQTKTWLTCEGFFGDSSIGLSFASEKEKDRHKRRYCCRDYQSCPLAKADYEKYREEYPEGVQP